MSDDEIARRIVVDSASAAREPAAEPRNVVPYSSLATAAKLKEKFLASPPQPVAEPPSLAAMAEARAHALLQAEVPTLSPNAPMDNAREFARRHCYVNGECVVWYWQGQFWRWNGKFYAAEDHEETQGQVWKFLDGAERWAGQGQTERFKPTERHVSGVLSALKACLALGKVCAPPMWLRKRERATDWIVFRNGVVNILTGEVRNPSPDLWVHSALELDWKPEAACPRWVQFLEEAFPGDEESKTFLEEFMGYCMTEETRFQKGAMFVGKPRSGKGTIIHVLHKIVGEPGYVALSFDTWVATENSRAPMIGKRVGVFADVRFKPGRHYGSSYDPGGISPASIALMLNITGEDPLTIGRKMIGAWEGQLRLKLITLSNPVLNFNDPTLPTRMIKLNFGVSFYNREDNYLKEKLFAELPGIAARCVAAYQRLCRRGKFVQPRSGLALDRAVLAASDPFSAMALECFVPDHAGSAIKKIAAARFNRWREENNRLDVVVPENKFGERLRTVPGFEHIDGEHRPIDPATGKQERVWLGMRLRE